MSLPRGHGTGQASARYFFLGLYICFRFPPTQALLPKTAKRNNLY